MNEKNLPEQLPAKVGVVTPPSIFSSPENFDHAQRMAKMLSSSDLVPAQYQGGTQKAIANTMIAIELSQRIGLPAFMVMQNVDIIQGKPSWSSKFLIGAVNSSGRFSPLRFEMKNIGAKSVVYEYWVGKKPNRQKKSQTVKITDVKCRAYATEKSTGQKLEGPWISIEMAVKEGWYTKSGSKWPTMPELMLEYRAASFFTRVYCPEIGLGLSTREEVIDAEFEVIHDDKLDELNSLVDQQPEPEPTKEEKPKAAKKAKDKNPEPEPEPDPDPDDDDPDGDGITDVEFEETDPDDDGEHDGDGGEDDYV